MKLGTIVSDLAKAGQDVKNFFLKVAKDAPAAVQDVTADVNALAPVIEAFVPGSAAAINLGESLLDKIAQAVEDAGAAAGANGLTVSLDQATVTAVKAVIASAKTAAAAA
jgi:hypothetical protein